MPQNKIKAKISRKEYAFFPFSYFLRKYLNRRAKRITNTPHIGKNILGKGAGLNNSATGTGTNNIQEPVRRSLTPFFFKFLKEENAERRRTGKNEIMRDA